MNCPNCGSPLKLDDAFCQVCGSPINTQTGDNVIGLGVNENIQVEKSVKNKTPKKEEKIKQGLIGAALGIGFGCLGLLLLYKLGYLVLLAGPLMGSLTILFYINKSGCIRKKGIIICTILMIISIIIVFNVALAIDNTNTMKSFGYKPTFLDTFVSIPRLFKYEYISLKAYLIKLLGTIILNIATTIGIVLFKAHKE